MSENGTRTDWLHEAKWGVFMHFLACPASSSQGEEYDSETWNKRVDAFDVPGTVKQLRETGARYFVLTLGQNSGHYCVPNAAYDRITGIRPSKCARRDLVSELYEALAPHGIRLMVYVTAGAPGYATEAVKKLAWGKGGRCAEFQRHWESVIREWSLRWGRKVSGWWFDGCYFNDQMYRHADAPNFKSFAAAIRAGNPDSLIGWNPGITHPPYTVDAEEDYTAGEVNEPELFDSPGRWDKHAQFHVLTYLGKSWGQLPIRFDAREAIDHTLAFTNYGGVVTWDVPLTYEGHIDAGAFAVLKQIGKAVDATRGKPDMTVPKLVRPFVTFLETPAEGDKGFAVGRVQVTLKNKWDVRIQGQVAVTLDPASVGCVEEHGVIAYDLEPGAVTQTEVRFRMNGAPSADTPVRLLLSRTESDRTLVYRLPKRERVKISQLDSVPALEGIERAMAKVPGRLIINGQGRTLAEIKLAVADGQLAILCRATDAIMRQTENVWDGSCVEVFGVAEPGDLINQLWFVPATAECPVKALEIVRSAEGQPMTIGPSDKLKLASWANATGYTSAALVPLAWWLRQPETPARFYLEIIVNAGLDAKVFGRASMFGSFDAPNHTDGYAIIEAS